MPVSSSAFPARPPEPSWRMRLRVPSASCCPKEHEGRSSAPYSR
jgi:hypothetical protein